MLFEINRIVGGDNLRRTSRNASEKNSWSDDEDDVEMVCYLVGVPAEYNEQTVKDSLAQQGLPIPVKMGWKEFEGLDYLKCVFGSKEEAEKLINQTISLNNIPIIVIPKVQNKNPLELLVHHQLRIQSLTGPIDSKIVNEFLIKFGKVADFLTLDSLNHPTTFVVTYAHISSKTLLAGYSQDNTITITDNNTEKKLKLDLNIKPVLVIRKKLSSNFNSNPSGYHTSTNRSLDRMSINYRYLNNTIDSNPSSSMVLPDYLPENLNHPYPSASQMIQHPNYPQDPHTQWNPYPPDNYYPPTTSDIGYGNRPLSTGYPYGKTFQIVNNHKKIIIPTITLLQ